jgi:hypothetical protein
MHMRTLAEKLANYYRGAHIRAQRRKSAWNLLLLPLCFAAWLSIWYALFRFVWLLHVLVYPAHRLADFWSGGISAGTAVLSFLMVFALMPAAMTLGFMLENCVVWLIPPLRRVFDAEARDYPGTGFADAMRGLLKVCYWALPIGLTISVTAAWFLSSLR